MRSPKAGIDLGVCAAIFSRRRAKRNGGLRGGDRQLDRLGLLLALHRLGADERVEEVDLGRVDRLEAMEGHALDARPRLSGTSSTLRLLDPVLVVSDVHKHTAA